MKPPIGRIALAASALLGLAAAVGLFLVPVPPLQGTFSPKALADPDSQFIRINGLDIHVKTMGQDQPVFVLLHGFAASLYSWQAVMQTFSQLGAVIAFDRPGFGLSEHPLSWQGQNPYSPEAQIELVIGLLDALGVQQAILVGNSAGGTVAMQVAQTHPERVSALILVDPAVYQGGGAPAWARPLLATPQMRRLGPLFVRQLQERGPELIKLAWHDPALLPLEMLELYSKPFQVDNWDRALWEFTLANRTTGLAAHLGELTQPVLVITGDDDRIIPPQDAARLANELPNARLIVIAGAGHVPHEERPAEFMQAVASFMNDLRNQEQAA